MLIIYLVSIKYKHACFCCFSEQVVNFSKPVRIPPENTVAPFYIQFIANGSDIAFSTVLRVYTNASIFTVPIHCYNGKLKVSFVVVDDMLSYHLAMIQCMESHPHILLEWKIVTSIGHSLCW